MTDKNEIARLRTLKAQESCDHSFAVYEQLKEMADELRKKAKLYDEMADIVLTSQSKLWSYAYEYAEKYVEGDGFWAWVYADKEWEKKGYQQKNRAILEDLK